MQKLAGWQIFPVLIAGMSILVAGCSPSDPVPKQSNGVKSGTHSESQTGSLLSTEEAIAILSLHSRGIGHLENREWAEADATLTQLPQKLPGNRDAAKNLAIGRILSLLDKESPFSMSKDPQAYSNMVQKAHAAVDAYAKFATSDEDKAFAALLSGKLAVVEDSGTDLHIAEGIEQLRKATRLAPERADYWYALASALSGHRDYADSPELIQVLQKTLELEPQNLSVLVQLIERQALALNSRNDKTKELAGGLPDTFRKAIVLIEPLNSAIKALRRMDLIETIQKVLDTPNAKPATQMQTGMIVKNLLVAEIATKIDLRRIDRNLLEYLTIDLAATLELNPATRAELFTKAEPTVLREFSIGSGPPVVTGASEVQALDMNLDGIDDLIVVEDGRVRVYARPSQDSSDWSVVMETPADSAPITNYLLVDLDRDFDKTLADIKSPTVLRDRDGDRKIVKDVADQQRWFDTDADLVAWGESGVALFRNQKNDDGTRSLIPMPQSSSVSTINDVVAADLEADGDLDLFFATTSGIEVWKNLSDGEAFEPMTDGVSLPQHEIVSLAIADMNHDLAIDVVGLSKDGKTGWLQNIFHGRMRWLDDLMSADGAVDFVIDECNRDGNWDLIATGSKGISVVLSKGSSKFPEASVVQLSGTSAKRILRADLDNDGRSDFITIGDTGLTLLRGAGDGTVEDLSSLLPSKIAASSMTTIDLDDDGDLDIVVTLADGTLQLLTNNGGEKNQWIDVVARAVGNDDQFPDRRVNMHAIGSVIEVRAGAAWQAHIIDSPRIHLGLGSATAADTIRIIWTDGIPQNITDTKLLKSRLGILAPQILKGSCPYIYTWNGKRFEFFSDCLWAAPIGLIQASGDMAPTREWEYLLIPGDKLKPRNDRYVLQLTEELWETAYFDEVRLMAVDHPADVSIFTNEKVGSPQMAAHRIHTVKHPRLPLSARDGLGRDLLPGLSAMDDDYVQPFRGRIMQGVVDEWTMEFDLGKLSDETGAKPNDVRLFLIGWVFPTDTSLNQAILQNPTLNPPAPPSLEVINSDGNWQTVRPFIGFPSGKTKAMVVDLSDAFLTDDYRIRIRSGMELYWDQAFFTVNESDAETTSQNCPLQSVDLHFRGFSRRVYADNTLFRNGHAPESYDYDSVTNEPRWNEIQGRFTRYGVATTLLESQDDQMVVMGPGDELTVEFTVPPSQPPTGWKRDFVLYNVGWDKDADLNTVYGQSSEPYPFKAMSRYPIAPDESEPASAAYQQYLQDFQTREYIPFRFRDAVRKQKID
ncbi:MAG TPA: FG-GAP-like repeat-containing protein [Planctomycetaceae bacterium]|nr:FG-GAP-like repeat-containing protein [Planctomycetaceae bacterium]